jgi:signal transduction histidine kinase
MLGLMATGSKIQKSPLGLAYNRAIGGNAGDPSFSGFVLDDSENKAVSYIFKILPASEGESLILAVKFNPDKFSSSISKRLLSDAGISTRLATRAIPDLVSVGSKFDGINDTPDDEGIFQRYTPSQSKLIGAAYKISFMGEDIYIIAEAPLANTTSGGLKLALAASSIPAIIFAIVSLFFFRSRLIDPLDALRVSLKSISASGVLDRVSPPSSGFEEILAISNLIKDLAHRLESQDSDEGSELKSLKKLADTLTERIEALEGELELRDESYAETRSQIFELVEVVKRQDNELARNGRKLDIAHKRMREMDDAYELFMGAAQRELINSTHSLISMVRQADNSANYPMSGAILDETKRLQRSVEKAVANLSLDSDYKSIPFEEVNLLDLAKEVLAGFADRAERKGISIDLKAKDGDWNIIAGQEYIRLVIENLIENAMDHSGDNGSVSLSLSQAQDSIRVEVSDSGAGLEADEIRQIFHRFKKLKSNDSDNSAGMGLGLYLCRVIIQRHDGKIGAHSEPGVGSSFFFEIPREPGHKQESLPGLIQNPDQ